MAEPLKIVDFAVIWRNMVDLGKPQQRITPELLAPLEEAGVRRAETEEWCVTNQVSQKVCSLNKKDLVRVELHPLQVLDEKRVRYWSDEEVLAALQDGPTYQLELYPALHTSGVAIFNFHCRFTYPEGLTVDEAIHLARLNLRFLAIEVPNSFLSDFPPATAEDRVRRFPGSDQTTVLIGGLKDFSADILRPLLHNLLSPTVGYARPRDMRCISSTLVQIYRTNPPCESIESFTEQYGRELLGIGSMNRNYLSWPTMYATESFRNDLAPDEEVGVYTLGLSDLIIFDTTLDELVKKDMADKNLRSPYSAVLYNSVHYSCLLEWVYLEKYIIDLYDHLLSRAISRETTTPENMLQLQKQSMRDLIEYRGGITPYPSRADFLEKARIAHRLPEAQEKIEKKRELATEYILQEYTLRTNRGIQLVNIFISATAVMGLMEVILSIRQGDNQLFWSLVTAGIFFLTLGILWGVTQIMIYGQKSD